MEKVVLITGAARGLGRALAAEFLAKNWRVIATDVDDLSMAGLLDSSKASIIAMDVTSDESVKKAFLQVEKKDIVIDLIINNAGIDRYFPLSEAPVEWFKQIFEVNVFGGYRVNQVFLPLIKKPGGRIIHISSESLNLTVPFMPYPLTKRMVENYARVLRMELKFSGIDVVIVRPGAIRTQLLNTVTKLNQTSNKWKLDAPFRKFAATASGEIGKTVSPEKVAEYIYKISGICNPSSVYRINNMLQLRIASLVPQWLLERIFIRHLSKP